MWKIITFYFDLSLGCVVCPPLYIAVSQASIVVGLASWLNGTQSGPNVNYAVYIYIEVAMVNKSQSSARMVSLPSTIYKAPCPYHPICTDCIGTHSGVHCLVVHLYSTYWRKWSSVHVFYCLSLSSHSSRLFIDTKQHAVASHVHLVSIMTMRSVLYWLYTD